MKAYRRNRELHSYLLQALDEGEWRTSHRFNKGKPRAGLHVSEDRKVICPYQESKEDCRTGISVIIVTILFTTLVSQVHVILRV